MHSIVARSLIDSWLINFAGVNWFLLRKANPPNWNCLMRRLCRKSGHLIIRSVCYDSSLIGSCSVPRRNTKLNVLRENGFERISCSLEGYF